jgi:hypothetical protein
LGRPSYPPSRIQEVLHPRRPPFSLPSNLHDATFPGAPSNVVSQEQSGIQQFLARARRHSTFESSSSLGVRDGPIDSIPKSAITELLQASHRRTRSVSSQDNHKKRKRLDSFFSSNI